MMAGRYPVLSVNGGMLVMGDQITPVRAQARARTRGKSRWWSTEQGKTVTRTGRAERECRGEKRGWAQRRTKHKMKEAKIDGKKMWPKDTSANEPKMSCVCGYCVLATSPIETPRATTKGTALTLFWSSSLCHLEHRNRLGSTQ